MKLSRDFYIREDVVQVAKDLLGKYLFSNFDGGITAGIITETEAYEGSTDRASHAYGGRRTTRTEVMYARGGVAYIYLCYGVHSLFNIVTNVENVPHAVLVRAVEPIEGIDLMKVRTNKSMLGKGAGTGPGKVSKLMGFHYSDTGTDLLGERIWLEDRGLIIGDNIIAGPRIGVDYAGEDALLPYRFRVTDGLFRK